MGPCEEVCAHLPPHDSLQSSISFAFSLSYLFVRFYDKISKSYRREEWYSLLTHSLECSLHCALKLGNTQAYLKHSLDLITTRIVSPRRYFSSLLLPSFSLSSLLPLSWLPLGTTNSKQDKIKMQSEIIKILQASQY